ncbi:MAG: enoyl-CoA hydratase/isomerase family protein [Candidatus Rokubacteria bacterium]|nr:enoyl-CoA hydratase/isomerase family protein [Candidatus Rokubacteria bacterium]
MKEPGFHLSQLVNVSREGAIAWITLNRPARRNALDDDLLVALDGALAALRDDAGTRVVVLTGAAPVFSAGADTRDPSDRFLRRFSRVLDALEALEPPTIAMVNGHAVGAGWALALACDFRVAADDAQFWLPEADLGIALAVPLAVRFVRVVGPAWTKAIAMEARRYPAREAQALGLVHEVVEGPALAGRVRQRADALAGTPSGPLAEAKARINLLARIGAPEIAPSPTT